MASADSALHFDTASAISDCYYDKSGDLATAEFTEEELTNRISERLPKSDTDFTLTSLKKVLNESKRKVCPTHEISACECDAESYEERTFYTISVDDLIEEWADAVRTTQDSLFTSFEPEKDDQNNWRINADTGQNTIQFRLFLNKNKLERYSSKPESFELPVSFVYSSRNREDFVYDWIDLLSPNFEKNFTSDLSDLRETYSTPICEYDSNEGIREEIRFAIREFFESRGYSIERDKKDACPEASTFGINLSKGEFVAVNQGGDGKILLCHCDNEDFWHGHYFRNGELVSMQGHDDFNSLSDRVEKRIQSYRSLQSDQQSTSSLNQIVAGSLVVLGSVLALASYTSLKILVSQFLPSSLTSTTISALFVLVYVAAILLVAYVLVRPHYEDLIFTWGITDEKINPNLGQKIARILGRA